MKALAALAAVAVPLLPIAYAATAEGAFAVLFGWVPFLGRVLPGVAPDGPTVGVGAAAFLLFAAGVHRLGRAWHPASAASPWRLKWTAYAVLGTVLPFAAGIAVVGVVHQVAWLSGSDRPLLSEGLKDRGHPRNEAQAIGSGLRNAGSLSGKLPPGGTFAPDGQMLHGWEAHLLVHLGYSAPIDMNVPWDAPANRAYFRCVVPAFINPGFRTPALEDANGFGLSHYAANVRVMGPNRTTRLADLPNGGSNTIAVGEVSAGFRPWGHPVNWRDPAAAPGRPESGFGGPPGAGGTHFVMADGSVRFVTDGTDPAVLRMLADPAAAAPTGDDAPGPGR